MALCGVLSQRCSRLAGNLCIAAAAGSPASDALSTPTPSPSEPGKNADRMFSCNRRANEHVCTSLIAQVCKRPHSRGKLGGHNGLQPARSRSGDYCTCRCITHVPQDTVVPRHPYEIDHGGHYRWSSRWQQWRSKCTPVLVLSGRPGPAYRPIHRCSIQRCHKAPWPLVQGMRHQGAFVGL
jgi:hypothetical protein